MTESTRGRPRIAAGTRRTVGVMLTDQHTSELAVLQAAWGNCSVSEAVRRAISAAAANIKQQ